LCLDSRKGQDVKEGMPGKAVRAGLAVGAVSLVLAAPAHAEGSWTSSFSGIRPGWNTRQWTDTNRDAAQTSLTIKSCRQDNGNRFTSMLWQLTYNNTFTPDENMGRHNLDCRAATGARVNYGDVKRGNYVFGYISTTGSTSYYYSAPYIGVGY
jgi:hypothetical protein